MNFKNMNLENRKKFEKIAYENGLNIQHDNSKKVADDKNPYWSEPTYYAYAGYCLALSENTLIKDKIIDDLQTSYDTDMYNACGDSSQPLIDLDAAKCAVEENL
jgi:hypothetical protein